MPALHHFPELCGCVYIMAHTDDLLTHAKCELDQLAAFGWKISKDQTADCDIQILDSDKIENMQHEVATVILCKAPHDAAIEPDGIAILSALGAGQIERDLAAVWIRMCWWTKCWSG